MRHGESFRETKWTDGAESNGAQERHCDRVDREAPWKGDSEGELSDEMMGPQEGLGGGPGSTLRRGEGPQQAQSCVHWTG